MAEIWKEIQAAISDATGRPFSLSSKKPAGGGCIAESWILEGSGQRYFVKTGPLPFDMEKEGLEAIEKTGSIRVPEVVCIGESANGFFLVLEHVEMRRSARDFASLGRQIAAMHRNTGPSFGWRCDNLIGSTRQMNGWEKDWAGFWERNRLGFQFDLAQSKGFSFGKRAERLLSRVSDLLSGHSPAPSLLHGDLWSGNAGFDSSGNPLIYDPAVYYGDREADLAMTELFGGFPGEFLTAYGEAYPLAPGYQTRKILYNLYHVLNHVNLFGGSYLGQAGSMIDRLLAEAG